MTALMILGLVLLPFALAFGCAVNTSHKEQTSVNMMTRSAARGLRRRARKSGISEEEAYRRWLARKQKSLFATPKPYRPRKPESPFSR